MKGTVNEKSDVVGRERGKHGRVCDYHARCSWLCRDTPGNTSKRRGKGDAARAYSVCSERLRKLVSEQGSVTAEFAVVLPSVILILVMGIQVLVIQTGRMTMVTLASEGSRALARGEALNLVEELIAERSRGLKSSVEYLDLSVCLEISEDYKVAGYLDIPITERACARKSGL